MPTTPVLGLPYPTSADTADVPRDIKALADAVDAQPSLLPVAAVFLWPLAAVPAGSLPSGKAAFLLCNGQLVSATDYPKLAALLGAVGGNVTIPDLRDRVPLGASASKLLLSIGGEETHRLTAGESGTAIHGHGNTIATASAGSHTHEPPDPWYFLVVDRAITGGWVDAEHTAGNERSIIGENLSAPLIDQATATKAGGAHTHPMTGAVTNAVGADAANSHNNLQPYLSLNYVMRAA